ncbi:MAG: hypothetical protein QUS09_08090 [Methanotrichaceae archaeon]|nr:hypothetical protein [Methanotrichaceae archaeon]
MVKEDAVLEEETVRGVNGFLQLLKEMEEKGEKKKQISGVLKGPFYSQAVYSGVVRIGIVRE